MIVDTLYIILYTPQQYRNKQSHILNGYTQLSKKHTFKNPNKFFTTTSRQQQMY